MSTASRECRNKMADQVLSSPDSFRPLLELALETHSDLGSLCQLDCGIYL